MPLQIRTTGLDEYLDPTGGAWIKMLVMGDAGTGKTPSAAQWPKPIFADCENGLMSVATLKVPYASIQTSADMDALLEELRRDSLLPPERRKYQTLVIDTVDTYQRKLIQERLKAERKDTFSGHGDWGWLEAKLVAFIEKILNLKMNVIVNMHVKDQEDGDEDSKILVKKAKLKGDIKDSIWQDFDLIGLMEKTWVMEGGERVARRQIRWHSEPRFPTLRDRSNTLPRFTDVTFTPADYQQIFDALTSGLDSVPESAVLDTLEVEGDGAEVPGPDEKGGAVDKPALPRPAPAKKAAPAAKKAAPAKKAAAAPAKAEEPKAEEPKAEEPAKTEAATPVAEPEAATPVAEPEEAKPAEDAWQPNGDEPPAWQSPNGKGTADEPIVLPATVSMTAESQAKETLEHVHSEDGTCLKNAFGELCHLAGLGTTVEETPNEPEPAKPEPTQAKAAAPADAKAAKKCGDQPPSMVGKHEPVPGCGVELTPENAVKFQIGMLRKKTYLCDDCNS